MNNKIKLKLKGDDVLILNGLWRYFPNQYVNDNMEKVYISILKNIREKVEKKAIHIRLRNKGNKTNTLSLEVYEAFFLAQFYDRIMKSVLKDTTNYLNILINNTISIIIDKINKVRV